jgi:hypothetical protein
MTTCAQIATIKTKVAVIFAAIVCSARYCPMGCGCTGERAARRGGRTNPRGFSPA